MQIQPALTAKFLGFRNAGEGGGEQSTEGVFIKNW